MAILRLYAAHGQTYARVRMYEGSSSYEVPRTDLGTYHVLAEE
jgi:hypothetical protein